MDQVGCTLPHWIINTTSPTCVGQQLKNIRRLLSDVHDYPDPCQTVEKVLYSYEETGGLENLETIIESSTNWNQRYDRKEIFQVLLNFQGDSYMEITQTRAYDLQSLIGNAGGYVGLFLGVALIQLPTSILCGLRLIKNLLKRT